MSGRGASAAVLVEQAKAANMAGHLFEAYFDDEVVRATDFGHPVTWGANTYAGAGHLLNYDAVRETAELLISQAKVTLSGVDQTWIARVLTKNYLDRRIVIYEAFKDQATGQVLADPLPRFDGLMGRPLITEDPQSGDCKVEVDCSNHLVDFDRKTGRHTNDSEQKIWFPNDDGFNQVSEASQPTLWGRE